MIHNHQETLPNRPDEDIDYSQQNFDELDANPYEIVVAIAKAAREINDKVQKYYGPDFELRPTNLLLKKLQTGEASIGYNSKDKNSTDDPETAV